MKSFKDTNSIGFIGDYYFFSNFSSYSVTFDGIQYLNSEAAFQAQKTEPYDRYRFAYLMPRDAKSLGRKVHLRADWEEVKDELMYKICKAKMQQNHLEQKVLETRNTKLVEFNKWHDNYWGVCTCNLCMGKGQNRLGETWMRIRDELQKMSANKKG